MVFTAEQIITVVLPIVGAMGLILRAWGQLISRRADAEATERIAKAHAAQKEKEAEANAKIKEAETRLNDSQAQREQEAAVMKLLERQQTIIEGQEEMVKERDKEHLSRYGTIAQITLDINRQLTNLYNWADKMSEWKDDATLLMQKMLEGIETLPQQFATTNTDTLTNLAQHLGAEMGMVLAQQMALHQLERDLFPFPDAEDDRWETVKVIPVNPATATIWKQPQFRDEAILKKPCAQIKPEGEMVKIIRGQIKNWWIIYKVGTDSDCWGWIPEGKVKILEGEPAA